ncbi:hypothetical protein [Streptomyces sp. SLBN-118]|uniref:hypothetical protein n=1 Tax=Streptomyces sp. SLBN-118 TaxID=2768454 RepID=UPI00114D81F8|nr:hypothetical protein [Streptomyces sp. SLBN-118]
MTAGSRPAEPDRMLCDDVHHIIGRPPSFRRGRTALIGDAAHAKATGGRRSARMLPEHTTYA